MSPSHMHPSLRFSSDACRAALLLIMGGGGISTSPPPIATSLLFVLMLLLARLHLPPLSLAVELMPSGAFAPPCSPVAYLPVFGPGSLVDAS